MKNYVHHGEKQPHQEVGGGYILVKNTMMPAGRRRLNLSPCGSQSGSIY